MKKKISHEYQKLSGLEQCLNMIIGSLTLYLFKKYRKSKPLLCLKLPTHLELPTKGDVNPVSFNPRVKK